MTALIIIFIILLFSDITITITRNNKTPWKFEWSLKKLLDRNSQH